MAHAVIITGMHRSGTSLLSSLLQRSGVNVGERLIAANSANPRGYFEDVDFYEFHEGLLHQRGQTYLHVNDNFTFQPTDSETAGANKLIAERSHLQMWGWKDPRTSLFLDFWRGLLPHGRFLFVFRHPIEVLLSLLRRGEFDSHPTLLAGLNAWHTYNQKIEAFVDSRPGNCLLVHIDGVVQQSDEFARLLRDKLQLDISFDAETLARSFHSNELKRTPLSSELIATLAKIHPQSLELHQRLIEKADLAGNETETNSTASAELSRLAHFCDGLTGPVSASVKQGLVHLLLYSLAPEAADKMLATFSQSTKETQQKIDYLWMEVQRFQRLEDVQTDELERLRQVVEEQQSKLEQAHQLETQQAEELQRLGKLVEVQDQSLDNLQWLNLEQIKELDRQAAHIECLTAELGSIHDTRIWKAIESYRRFKNRWRTAA